METSQLIVLSVVLLVILCWSKKKTEGNADLSAGHSQQTKFATEGVNAELTNEEKKAKCKAMGQRYYWCECAEGRCYVPEVSARGSSSPAANNCYNCPGTWYPESCKCTVNSSQASSNM